jgi:1-acyl-sn-glycerol-3-phosphate acyltransferase
MSIWPMISLSCLLLAGSWMLMPERAADSEIRGIYRILHVVNRLYCAFVHGLETNGPAPLPVTGAAILIANHTCGADNLLLQAGCERILGFMVAKEWYDNRWIHRLCTLLGCIPVNRDGHDFGATRAALRALKDGRVLPIFPEGTILPTSGRELGAGKPGAAFLALRARVPIVPAYIWGTPCTEDVWRAIRTISHSRVVFGRPLDLSDLDAELAGDRATLEVATQRLMGAINELRLGVLAREAIVPNPSAAPWDDSNDRRCVEGDNRAV